MKVTMGNVIRIEEPTKPLLDYMESHLTFPNPEYERRKRMGLWLGRTPRYITLYRLEGNSIVVPYGMRFTVETFVGKNDIAYRFRELPSVHPDYLAEAVKKMGLRDYQIHACATIIAYGNGILVAPPGSGKTQMGLATIFRYAKPALWLTHTKDLARQTYERACQYIDKSLIGICEEGKINIGSLLTIAVINTLASTDLAPLRDKFSVVVVDECHRVSGSMTKLTMFLKVLSSLSAEHKFGLSATMRRADGLVETTYAILGPVACEVPESATEDYLMPVSVQPVKSVAMADETCYGPDGMIDYSGLLKKLTMDPVRNRLISGLIEHDKGHSVLVLSERLEHLRLLMGFLPEDMRKDAIYLDGSTKDRDGLLEAMRRGDKKYMFASFQLAKEGLDIPRLDRLVIASPVKDEAVVEQSIGRIARKAEGKDSAIVYDIVDTSIPYCYRAFLRNRCRWYRKKGARIANGYVADTR